MATSSEPRTHTVSIRVSDEELGQLEALVERIPVTNRGAILSAALRHGLSSLNEDSQEILEEPLAVERMQSLRDEGLTLRAIAERLTEEGHRTRRGGTWAAETVRKMLARADAAKSEPARRRKAR
jgi:hypothetical protein